MRIDSDVVEAWARRIRGYESEAEYHALLAELRSDPAFAAALLDRLAEHRDPIVRGWAGTAARLLFGGEAVPLLTRLLEDRDPDIRDGARDDLVAIDPMFERTFLPTYRRILGRRADPWGEDQRAMYHLARARDPEAVPLLRAYAAHYDARYWHNRTPLVLADYIEDPGSVARRILAHDHDFMFWLVDAAMILGIEDARETLEAALTLPMDEECHEIIRGWLAVPR